MRTIEDTAPKPLGPADVTRVLFERGQFGGAGGRRLIAKRNRALSSTVSAQFGATTAPVRFGVFTFDVLSCELHRDGGRVTIGEQPAQVLRLLLERHGELVTREDLRAMLWRDQTFIDDFDQGLNAAVKRLRDVPGDKVDNRNSSKPSRDGATGSSRRWMDPRRFRHLQSPQRVSGGGDGHDREHSGLAG